MKARSGMSHALQSGLKAGLIGFLILLFLIPVGMIREVRSERERYRAEAVGDISSKAGGATRVSTPYLTVPVRYDVRETNSKGETTIRTRREVFCVFPQAMTLEGNSRTELRKRGIHSVPVHQSDFSMDLEFAFNPSETGIAGARAAWDSARIHYAYDDPRALRESPALVLPDGTRRVLRSGTPTIALAERSVSAPAPMAADSAYGSGRFAARLELRLSGAESVFFRPLADANTIRLSCDWASPSFSGYRLPESRELGASGFQARWFVDEASRPIPRVLDVDEFNGEASRGADFGVEFLQPTDVYRQIHRALRYAVIFLFIPFAALFLFEVLARRRLHVVQYILVGLANCLFYLLLLALAEHIPFPAAYLASAAAVSLVTAFYVSAFLPRKRSALLVLAAFVLQYGYLYCALSSEDYALLIGSIGLFCVVAFTMAATRKVDWYSDGNRRLRHGLGPLPQDPDAEDIGTQDPDAGDVQP